MCIELIKGICIDTQVLLAIGILIIIILAYKLLKI